MSANEPTPHRPEQLDELGRPKPTRRRTRVDASLRELAAEQHGLIDVAEAMRRGIRRTSIDRRIREGALVCVRRGIYRQPGSAPTERQRIAAALLAAGTGAVAIGRSAAFLHGLSSRAPLEVAVPPHRCIALPGVEVRRLVIPALEVTTAARLDVTTVARTLLDLADARPLSEVRKLLDDAMSRRLVSIETLWQFVHTKHHHPGVPVLRHLLGERADGQARFRSQSERDAMALLRGAGLGDAISNHPVIDADGNDRIIDFAWVEDRVGLELATFRWHTGRAAWAADAHRFNALSAIGWRMVVATDADLDDRLRRPIAALQRLLGRGTHGTR